MNYMDEYDFCSQYLVDEEYILWKGRPGKGKLLTGGDFIMIPFSLAWLAFSIFWEITAIRSSSSIFLALWGIPFVAVGLYLLFGRLIQKAYLRNKTFYVITNKKIIVKRGNKIEMHNGEDLPSMNITLHSNGNGTILFSDDVYTQRGRRRSTFFALENIPDVAQAQNAIDRMER